MRRHRPVDRENHDRWLVSYADFVTLLFGLFVVMFASSQTDKARAKEVSEAVMKALENGKSVSIPPAVARILGGTVDEMRLGNAQMKGPGGAQKAAKEALPAEIIELAPSLRFLSSLLSQEIKAGKVEVSMQPRGLVVSLKQAAFFPSGTDVLDAGSLDTVGKVAQALSAISNPVRIEGHTDTVPIHTGRFRTNWELSAARAISMMETLATPFGIPYQRMAIVGYADTAPIASNETFDGRARNRRVDLVILNTYALAKTEATRKK